MTNGDKIRSMSDVELAKFIRNNDDCECCAFVFASGDCNSNFCAVGIKKWLESEVDKND